MNGFLRTPAPSTSWTLTRSRHESRASWRLFHLFPILSHTCLGHVLDGTQNCKTHETQMLVHLDDTRDPTGDPLCVTPEGTQMTDLHLPEKHDRLWQKCLRIRHSQPVSLERVETHHDSPIHVNTKRPCHSTHRSDIFHGVSHNHDVSLSLTIPGTSSARGIKPPCYSNPGSFRLT